MSQDIIKRLIDNLENNNTAVAIIKNVTEVIYHKLENILNKDLEYRRNYI